MITALLLLTLGGLAVAVWFQRTEITDLRLQATEDRLDFQHAFDTAVDARDGVVALIRAGREIADLARRHAIGPERDTDRCVDVLLDLTDSGPLSEDAIDAILRPEADVIAGEAVEVAS